MSEQQTLTVEQALDSVAIACMAYKGDFKEHQILQESLKLIKEKLETKKEAKAE